MTEQFLNDMYLIAIKSKLQRNSISTEEKLKIVLEELKSLSENTGVRPCLCGLNLMYTKTSLIL